MRVELTEKNTVKLQKVGLELDRSVNDLTNLLIDFIDEVEIKTHISIKVKKEGDALTPPSPEKSHHIVKRRRLHFRLK